MADGAQRPVLAEAGADIPTLKRRKPRGQRGFRFKRTKGLAPSTFRMATASNGYGTRSLREFHVREALVNLVF